MFGMDTGYWLYMNEKEGTKLVNTRQGRINSLGRELRARGYAGKVVPHAVFAALLEKFKLNDITKDEISYIEREWL